jgi:hypothetical protein
MKNNDILSRKLVENSRDHHPFMKGCGPDLYVEQAEHTNTLSQIENTLLCAKEDALDAAYYIDSYRMFDQWLKHLSAQKTKFRSKPKTSRTCVMHETVNQSVRDHEIRKS